MIKKFNNSKDWFFSKPFGLFVHWGLYSIPAWHEQIQWRKGIDRAEYGKYLQQFNPVKFDPDQWIDIAQKAGMEHITITTKHHDGFCLWDSEYTTFNIMNTPYKKDIIKLLADACHRRNFPFRFYYSVADWHHPNYPNRGNEGVSHELPEPLLGDEPNEKKYIEYLTNQVRELCTKYGEIHGIWWDVNKLTYRDLELKEMIHELQPKAVVNDRGFSKGDYQTSERDYNLGKESGLRAFDSPMEAVQSVGMDSWGYRENENYYTDKYLMQSIDRMMARGASYLLNVGPKSDGTIFEKDVSILKNIGSWFAKIKESLVDVESCSELTDNTALTLTCRGNAVYVHLHNEPNGTSLVLNPISKMPSKIELLNNGKSLRGALDDIPRFFTLKHSVLSIHDLPVKDMREEVMVVKLTFDNIEDIKNVVKNTEFEG